MSTKGSVEMGQLYRLFEVGIDAVGMYAKITGRSASAVQADLSDKNISAEEFINTVTVAMMEGTNGVTKIAGAAKEAGASWGGSFDNMRAAVTRGVVNIVQNIDKMLKDNGLPDMRKMVANFGKTMEKMLNQAADNIPVVIEKFKEWKKMLEPHLPLIKGIAIAIGGFIATLTSLNSVMNIVRGAMAALNLVMSMNPIILVISLIVGLIAALVLAYQNVEWFRDMVNSAWAWLKDATLVAFGAIKDFIMAIVNDVVAFVQPILEQFKEFWAENGEQILSYVKMYFGLVWEHIKLVIGHIKALFQMVWPIVSGIVKIAWNNIKFFVKHYI